MKHLKRISMALVSGALVVSLFCTWTPPAMAAAGTPYGAHDLFLIPCTCTAGALNWHFFAPLYEGSVPMVGALVAPITPLTYSNYYLHPGAWILGFFTPGAGVCAIGVTPYCYQLPSYGLVIPFAGTSP